jgi:hypothetical protein
MEPLRVPGSTSREPIPDTEMQRSMRGKNITTFVGKLPEGTPPEDARRQAASTAMLSVREKSSHQLRDCMGTDVEEAPRLNEEGRFTTRSQLLAARREQLAAENMEIGKNPRLTLPSGSQPGAPGKNPEVKRFTHRKETRNWSRMHVVQICRLRSPL